MEHLKILEKKYKDLDDSLFELDPCAEFPECEWCLDAIELIVKQMEAISIEIERRFLVSNFWLEDNETLLKTLYIKQGYLSVVPEKTIRIRLIKEGAIKSAYICIKTKTYKYARKEFEYKVPYEDGVYMFENLCDFTLEKVRSVVEVKSRKKTQIWEVDVFNNQNKGLCIAEVELYNRTNNVYKPNWVGKEITEDWKYACSNLAIVPFSEWEK